MARRNEDSVVDVPGLFSGFLALNREEISSSEPTKARGMSQHIDIDKIGHHGYAEKMKQWQSRCSMQF